MGAVVESDAVEIDLRCESPWRVGGCSVTADTTLGPPSFVILLVVAGRAFARRRVRETRPT